MGSPCLFTRQQALKLGYFYWLRVKNSNLLLTELSRCYLKHTKFYLEHKASFIQISSIASFNSFLIAWLWGYCTFSDSSVVSLKSSPWPKYTKYETIFPKKIMFSQYRVRSPKQGNYLKASPHSPSCGPGAFSCQCGLFSLSWGWTSTEMINSLADFRVQYRIYPLRIGCHGMPQMIFSGTRVIMYTAHKRIFRWCTRLENGWE